MSSKSPKTDKKDNKKDKNENVWQKILETTAINDNKWKANVVMLIPFGTKPDFAYTQTFERIAIEEKRFVIKTITKSETYFMINQFNADKSKDEASLVEKALESMKTSKNNVSPDLMALFIKNKILELKKEDLNIKNQKTLLSEGLKQESHFLFEENEIPKVIKPTVAPTPQSSNKKKSAKTTASQENQSINVDKKFNTDLRERGEEWRDKTYIEDYPLDGPDLYIVITGFTDPHLPYWLIKYGVNVSAIVQVKIEASVMSAPSVLKKGKRSGHEFDPLIYESFWLDLNILKNNPETRDTFENTCFMVFTPPYNQESKLSNDADTIYNDISFLLYDIQDLMRQHTNYINNMKIYNVVHETRNKALSKFYSSTLPKIPNECINTVFVLENVLNTVESEYDGKIVPLSNSSSSTNTTTFDDEECGKIVKSVFKCLLGKSHKPSYKKIPINRNNKEVPTIEFQNYAKTKTFHLSNDISDEFEKNTTNLLSKLPVYNIFTAVPIVSDFERAKIDYHLNVLIHSFYREDIEYNELERLIYLLKCKHIYHKFTKEIKIVEDPLDLNKYVLKRNSQVKPLNIAKQSSTTIQTKDNDCAGDHIDGKNSKILIPALMNEELFELESAKDEIKSLSEYIFFQDNSEVSTAHAINEAFNQYTQCAINYCKLTDTFLLMFYNVFDNNRLYTKETNNSITTPICLEEFYEYVFSEQYDWLKEEEKYYDEVNKKKSPNAKDSGIFSEHSFDFACIGATDLETELLLDGSIKYDEVYKIASTHTLLSEQTKSDAKSAKKDKVKKPPESVTKLNTGKKGKKTFKSMTSFSTIGKNTTTESGTILDSKPFLGYDINEKRCEVKERENYYFSVDGKIIKSKWMKFLSSCSEFLTVSWQDPYGTIWVSFHKSIGPFTKPLPETINIATKEKLRIVLYKQNIQNEIVLNFKICWPNGLYIEAVLDENVAKISHIFQSYLKETTPLDIAYEIKRIITKTGIVMIFLKDGSIIIFNPDGTILNIKELNIETKLIEIPGSTDDVFPKKEQGNDSEGVSKTKIKKSKNKSETSIKSKGKKTSESLVKVAKNEVTVTEVNLKDYVMIHASGNKEIYSGTSIIRETLLVRTATDFTIGEAFIRREDGVSILLTKNGSRIVKFCDGTCITTHCVEYEVNEIEEDTDIIENTAQNNSDSSVFSNSEIGKENIFVMIDLIFIIEHKNYATVTINTNSDDIKISSPNNVALTIHSDVNFKIELNKQTNILAKRNEIKILNSSCSCNNCEVMPSETVIDFNFTNRTEEEAEQNDNLLEMFDSDGKTVKIDNNGFILVEGDQCLNKFGGDEEELLKIIKSADTAIPKSICWHLRGLYSNPRFFMLKRNMKSSELLSIRTVNEYRKAILSLQWALENHFKEFRGYRCLITIQQPVLLNETQKWMMESKLIPKPTNLLYCDLKTNSDTKFYKWFRPYARFQPTHFPHKPAIPPAMPLAFIIRNLERQWVDANGILRGVSQMLDALIRYKESLEIHCHCLLDDGYYDLRSEEEKGIANRIQAFAHSMREEIVMQMEAHMRGDNSHKVKAKDEELVSRLGDVVEMRPNLKKYWQRRAAEDRQQEYLRQIINVGPIPPYFEGLFGGAVWLILHTLLEEVMDIGDRNLKLQALNNQEEKKEDNNSELNEEGSDTTFDRICL